MSPFDVKADYLKLAGSVVKVIGLGDPRGDRVRIFGYGCVFVEIDLSYVGFYVSLRAIN